MPKTRRRWPRVIAAIASCLVLAASGAAAAGAAVIEGVIDDIPTLICEDCNQNDASSYDGKPVNILVMGSDNRKGEGNKYGKASYYIGARSDTTILVHVAADRGSAIAVSIPRDTMITLPVCKAKAGGTDGGRLSRFNEAFDIGGPACTVKAVEQETGVQIDHFVVVDFNGFKDVVNAIGGVEVCLKEAVDDTKAKLHLPAGKSVVKGEQALAFVRARLALGDGSDISRIGRQQDFISAAIRKATSMGVLTSPATLIRLLDAAAKSLTTDSGLAGVDRMTDLASSLTDLSPKDINFVTVPWEPYPTDPNVVQWTSQADQIWAAINNDQPYPPKPTTGADGQPLRAAPSTITVRVLNGSGTTGAAKDIGAQLTAVGFNVAAVGNAPAPAEQTRIEYGAASAEAARTLAAATGAQLVEVPGSGKQLTLILGADFGNVTTVTVPKKKTDSSQPPSKTAADKIVCAS